jgi:hypothetical protein
MFALFWPNVVFFNVTRDKKSKPLAHSNHFRFYPLFGGTSLWISLWDYLNQEISDKSVIMVVVDRLSKYAQLCALQHPFIASIVVQLFMDHVFKLHGMPHSIVSDQDPIFTNNFWQELFRVQGTQLCLNTTYHPHTNGQTEVANKCLETYLRCFSSERKNQWAQWLPLFEW